MNPRVTKKLFDISTEAGDRCRDYCRDDIKVRGEIFIAVCKAANVVYRDVEGEDREQETADFYLQNFNGTRVLHIRTPEARAWTRENASYLSAIQDQWLLPIDLRLVQGADIISVHPVFLNSTIERIVSADLSVEEVPG